MFWGLVWSAFPASCSEHEALRQDQEETQRARRSVVLHGSVKQSQVDVPTFHVRSFNGHLDNYQTLT